MNVFSARLMHSVAFASLAFASSAAQAQTQEDGARSAQGEAEAKEIIVTAQFRSQKLQDTPLSITALDASAMAERGQTNIIDVAKQTPSLTLEAGPANQGQTVIALSAVSARGTRASLSSRVSASMWTTYIWAP